jgi:hypothetical protein
MNAFARSLPRRTVLKGAGSSIGAGLLAGIAMPAAAAPTGDIWSAASWSNKGGVKLFLWPAMRNFLAAPEAAA